MKTLSPHNNLRMFRRKRVIERLEKTLKFSDKKLAAMSTSGATGSDQRKRIIAELETLKKRVI